MTVELLVILGRYWENHINMFGKAFCWASDWGWRGLGYQYGSSVWSKLSRENQWMKLYGGAVMAETVEQFSESGFKTLDTIIDVMCVKNNS